MNGPRCELHNSIMTYGRYSANSIYRDAQKQVGEHWYYCSTCVDQINEYVENNDILEIYEHFNCGVYAIKIRDPRGRINVIAIEDMFE